MNNSCFLCISESWMSLECCQSLVCSLIHRPPVGCDNLAPMWHLQLNPDLVWEMSPIWHVTMWQHHNCLHREGGLLNLPPSCHFLKCPICRETVWSWIFWRRPSDGSNKVCVVFLQLNMQFILKPGGWSSGKNRKENILLLTSSVHVCADAKLSVYLNY